MDGFKQNETPSSSCVATSRPGCGGKKRQKSVSLLTATTVLPFPPPVGAAEEDTARLPRANAARDNRLYMKE